ncbi:hypothetical protein Tco_0977770 [Tanacetum coccineum]|uniref:Retrovirus-related Pol polyprotein from transposon TNT 1-94-like beta-barrel domain-containing protein n=1 Tax=Tanacetum coccineum TaxID=301880 RepID=A0ABQ5EL22_9ASTR
MDSGGSYHMTHKRDYLFDFKEYDGGNVLLGDGRECRVWGTEGFTVKMQSGKITVIRSSLVVLSATRRANYVYTLDGQAMTRKTLKGRKQLGEYQTRWKIKMSKQQNGLVEETNVTLLAKVTIVSVGFKTPIDMLGFLVGLLVLSKGCLNQLRTIGFNESGKHKKPFIGSGVGTGSMQLQAKNKDLENVVCKMGKSTKTLWLLTNEQKAFRDNLRKSGLGYNGPYVLSQAYAKIPKLYRAYELCNKNEQLHVFDSEETLEDAEKSQLKMNEFQKDEKVQE